MRIIPIFLILTSLLCASANAIENSIVPLIEKLEKAENIQKQKYSTNQYQEIQNALLLQENKIRLVSWCDASNVENVVPVLKEMQPDIICFQQMYLDRIAGLQNGLGDEYAHYEEPLDGVVVNGFFYLKNRFEVFEQRTIGLPHDLGITLETLSLVQLKDLKSNKDFALFNGHLTFTNADLREAQARFIVDQIELIKNNSMPILFAGSLNLFPNRPDMVKLPFHDGDYVYRIITRSLYDTKEQAVLGHVGPIASYTNASDDGVPFTGTGTPGIIFDCLFATKDVQVLIHGTQPATINGKYPSEHMPLLVDVILDNQ